MHESLVIRRKEVNQCAQGCRRRVLVPKAVEPMKTKLEFYRWLSNSSCVSGAF